MSTFLIKITAIITMLIDHTGFFLLPQAVELRAVGRLSFPLFAWMIANGARHTKSINSYLARLFMFGLVSQVPFFLSYKAVGLSSPGLNVLFTLFIGLLCIKIITLQLDEPLKMASIAFLALAAQVFDMDYGLIGVLSILGFYVFYSDIKKVVLYQVFLYVGVLYFMIFMGEFSINEVTISQPLALLSLLFINAYNGKPGPKAKYLFYIVYPLQFLIFYGLVTYL